MKVIEIKGAFGIENLAPSERARPGPVGPGQVLLRMRAASLNFRDLMTVRGLYNPKQPLPLIPCSDGVGEVVETGPGVTRVKTGDRVATCFFQRWCAGRPTLEKAASTLGGPLDGTLAEYMLLGEGGVVPVPAHLTDAEGATLPCAALTAWSALVTQGDVKPGDSVLVQGTGGVALFALQFAKLLGARVMAISGSEDKLARAMALGADHGVNYKTTPRWSKAAREWSGGTGVDHIVEVGGAGTLQESLQAAGLGGQVSVIGVLAGASKELNILPILMKNVRLQGIFVGHREGFEAMNRAMARHGLKPVVDSTFPLDQAGEAFRRMERGEHFGKICLSHGC